MIFRFCKDLATVMLSVSVFLSVFTMTSCEEDAPEPELNLDPTLAVIAIDENAIDNEQDIWFYLTGSDGAIIGVQKAVEGVDLTFERPEGFMGETFTLHRLSY